MALPKMWLIHSVEYEEFTGERDSYGDPVYQDAITIDYVRVDNETVFSRDTTDKKILANAIVFVDAKHSTNVPDRFVEESKITFNEKTYTLKKVADLYYPNRNKLHHWELEVI